MRTLLFLLAVLGGLVLLTLHRSYSSAEPDADVAGAFGSPIAGLSPGDLVLFEEGRSVFRRRFTRAEGLGPHFNASACASCHEHPTEGGSSQRYRDFLLAGRTKADGTVAKAYGDCTTENQATQGSEPCLPSLVVPHYGPKGTLARPVAASVEHVAIPPDADVVAKRNAPPLFGVGLFRLVSDAEILSRADPDDADGDGISGRANVISKEDGALGRFGYKCQTASIEAFNRGALNNQMGITSDSTKLGLGDAAPPGRPGSILEEIIGLRVAHAQVANPEDRTVDFDAVPDPEISRDDLLALIFFQENLAAPRRGGITPAVRRGEASFDAIGCTACHRASLETPLGLIHPYTDLLVHDMGAGLSDGVVMDLAGGTEFRTQPLWGVAEHAPYLHDGRADTLEDAIAWHAGEARAARDRFEALSASERDDVLRFLESL